jgi:CRISPR system Cascade subunit CasE
VTEEKLHLVKVPLRIDKLATIAKRRDIPLRDLDDGYLAHCVLRELWQDAAPTPFVLRRAGRILDAWGYSRADYHALVEHARAFGDPTVVGAIDDVDAIASKPMPRFESGRRIGFLLRACPVVRLAKARAGHRAGAEVDAFLARCFEVGPSEVVDREAVYRGWLEKRLGDRATSGVVAETIRIAGIAREGLVRRTQGDNRQARRLQRPEVCFEGDLVIEDGDRFLRLLAHGVGRHRAFGFGALIAVPRGTSHPRS